MNNTSKRPEGTLRLFVSALFSALFVWK